MKQVYFCPSDKKVQGRFAVNAKQDWYEENIEPVVKIITDSTPSGCWRYDRDSCTWELSLRYWPATSYLLNAKGFVLKEVGGNPSGFREFTRDLTIITGYFAFLYLGLVLLANLVSPLIHDRGMRVRPAFFIFLLSSCFLLVRFKFYSKALLALGLLILLNPFDPIRISSWWLWQAINWATYVFILFATLITGVAASSEREVEHWYIYKKLAREK